MKAIFKLGITLAIYATVACGLLAVVDMGTAPLIAEAKAKETAEAMKVVFSDADDFAEDTTFTPDISTSVKVSKLYLAKKGGEIVGSVVQTTGPTYDKATILIGMKLDRTITGIQFTELSDTPGFGQKAAEPAFKNQFTGKSANDAFALGSDVTAITGATITSKGVTQIVKYATYIAGDFMAKNHGGAAGTGAPPVVAEEAKPFSHEDAVTSLWEKFENIALEEAVETLGDYPRNMLVKRRFLVRQNGKVIGAMATAQGETYHDGGVVLVAIDTNGIIVGARILQLNDTPNQGQRSLEEGYWRQFEGLEVQEPILSGEHYDTISTASITADCIADMVKVAAVEAAKYLAENGGPAYTGGDDYPLNEHWHRG
jgi:electron transport complex protein RnfG